MSNALRTAALAALMSTAASTSQASQRPTNSFRLSIQRDSFNSPAKVFPSRCGLPMPCAAASEAEAHAF